MLVAALIAPYVQRVTNVPMTLEDTATLIGLAAVVWHAGCTTFEKYFPPPNPTTPVKPAQEM